MGGGEKNQLEKSYFEVLNLCCSSEVPLIEKILNPLEGVNDVSVVVTSRTVIVVHDNRIISQQQIVKVLNQARLEANVRVYGAGNEVQFENRWPSPYAIASGFFLLLSFLKYVYGPLEWLALGAVVVGIGPIFLKSVSSIRNFTIDINILAVMAVMGSVALGDYWEAGTIVFLFSIAQWLEARASHKATAVMSSLVNVVPQRAVIAETGQEVDVGEVRLNTILAVKAGEIIPIDGVVVDGRCEVDEKTLTGEPFLVTKEVGSTVWAGTINLNGYVSVKTTALAEDCVVAKMATLVEEAQSSKSKTQRIIDKCAKFYTPVVVVISAGLAVIPAILAVDNQTEWFHKSLVVLISACPCALIISTPVATFCALSKAATSGLLIRGGEYIETLSSIKIMAFDKTGTITKGEFSVSDFRSLSHDVSLDTLLYWVASIESKSSHPMATALIDYGRLHSIEPMPEEVEEFENFPGEGICGKMNGKNIFIGNEKIAVRAGCTSVPELDSVAMGGKSIGYIFFGATPAGFFSLSDECRTGVKEAMDELKLMGIKVAMLTGDNNESAKLVQTKLGDALDVVRAGLLPQDKAKIVKDFQKEAPTAMVGDGLNDTPALATADIGISMGISGSALANETSHVILMSNDIRKIPEVIRLARKTRRKIIENISLSILPKVAIVALAFAGHPLVWAAVLGDVGTCVIVILSSMLLLKANLKQKNTEEQSQIRTKEYDGRTSSNSPLYDSLLSAPTKSESQGCCSKNSSSKCSSSSVKATTEEHKPLQKSGCCAQKKKHLEENSCAEKHKNTEEQSQKRIKDYDEAHKPLQKSGCCAQKKKPLEEKSCCAEKQKHLQEASPLDHESIAASSERKKCCSSPSPSSVGRCNKSVQSTSQTCKGTNVPDSSCFPADEEQGGGDEACCLVLNNDDSSKCRRHEADNSLGDLIKNALLGVDHMQQRPSGGCCKIYRKACCVRNGYSEAGTGTLSEIVIQ